MKRLKQGLAAVLSGAMLLSCQYTDTGERRDSATPLLMAAPGGSGEPAEVPRVTNEIRRLPLPQARKKWTVLVYLDGDNNLSRFSSRDVKEMMQSGSDGNINIVTLWDNDPSQDVSGAAARHGYYYVEHDRVTLLSDLGEVNMGSPKTAKNFAGYAVKNFPADRYLWIWWNHGGAVDRTAVMKGVCWDDSNGGDHLTETEQKEVMTYFKEKAGKKIDLVGFDACLMATAEIAYQYAPSASYLVASEQTIPGDGWDYAFISKIKSSPAMTAGTLAKQILAFYKNYYVKKGEEDATLSVMNLARAGAFAGALDDFAGACMASGLSGTAFRDLAKGLGMFGTYDEGDGECYYTKDLYEFLKRVRESSAMPAAVKSGAGACMELITDGKFITAEWHGAAWRGAAHGLAIMLKRATTVYRKLDICADTRWDEFLNWAKFPGNDFAF
jgi:hypothetical protein